MSHDTAHDHVQRHIGELAQEEHALERGLAVPLEPHRLEDITAALDQCWDLLRQRRARRAVALSADRAQVQPASIASSWQ